MLADELAVVTDARTAEQGSSGQNLGGREASWEAEWSSSYFVPAAAGATGAQAVGTVVKTPVALMALRGQKVTKVTIAACTPGRTAGCVTVVKLGPEGVDGGRFIYSSVG